jgi:hypothetical protein
MGDTCLESHWFFLMIFGIVFLILGVFIFFYLGYKKEQNDSIWHVQVDELHFNEPPEIIGQGKEYNKEGGTSPSAHGLNSHPFISGAFGVVILGQYRGTKVAVKRVLPPMIKRGGSQGSLAMSDSVDKTHATSSEIHLVSKPAPAKGGKNSRRGSGPKTVKINAAEATDLESGDSFVKGGNPKTSGSMSGSNKDWERLMSMDHSDNDMLRVLESATASGHDSVTFFGSVSTNRVVLRYIPMWMRWDEHSVRIREFQTEMRLISRLRVS